MSIPLPVDYWFEYPVRVQPHHTDYAGVVWHGTYITWLEEARVEALRLTGLDYAQLVSLGCELPVIDLAIQYRRPLKMGMTGLVKARMQPMQGVRIIWDYEICTSDGQLCVTAQVTLVTLDWQTGKIMRRLPPELKQVLDPKQALDLIDNPQADS
ncbi:MAG: acyl-CoA thioesterase [Pegethrix bostrychoides GSE-TBD4-15B]|jgi:acyl-CoA thioester hydrolase|uniref:Acyl-CoA thioesterase n=1 Tax=Pegethrix bostrychoides GSE-TBD4-15B TaxID=2839662 RepID=A0A951U3H6_9CYAN|nr:acyl-CoA thioesterase [Pegethrix bostrychoides GSE-TBD4-15B]